MKRRFFALFLAGGLMLGVCGCGGKTVSADDYMAQAEQEKTPVQDGSSLTSDSAGQANDTMSEGRYLGDYSVMELVDMLTSGKIAIEDIELDVAMGDVSYEDYEEILTYFPEEQKASTEQEVVQTTTDKPLEKPVTNVDLPDYMSTYVLEYEDFNGYQLRETISLSPIFSDTEDDLADMCVLWEALGGVAEEVPLKDELCEMSRPLHDYRGTGNLSNIKYIIGTRAIENVTDGFSITMYSPYIVNNEIVVDSTIDSPNEDTNARYAVTRNATTLLFYDDGEKCEVTVSAGIPLGGVKMTSDTWGPTRFIIALPNNITPNQPNGFAYDSLQYMFGPHPDLVQNKINFTLSNWND